MDTWCTNFSSQIEVEVKVKRSPLVVASAKTCPISQEVIVILGGDELRYIHRPG